MILSGASDRPHMPGSGGRATLDDLFRRAAARRPDALALIDPPNREAFTDGAARQLTYAQADRVIAAIAGRLRRVGLQTDAIVALQLANTVESVITLLAVLRAGLIAMPLPLLWRRADAVIALKRVGASALIANRRTGSADLVNNALQIAAEVFSVRHVGAFGSALPDGVIALDDLYTTDKLDSIPKIERERVPGAHLAVVTWDVAAQGLVPVARSHAELIAGAFANLLESRFERDAVILSTLTISTFAALATAVVPWLLVGGTLALHHPFEFEVFAAQRASLRPTDIVVPGALVAQFAQSGVFSAADGLRRVLGVWHAPERLLRAAAWTERDVALIDVQVFGETGLIPARRGPSGKPVAIAFGPITAPRGTTGSLIVGEVRPTPRGTVALRGPMVPRCAFPPGVERTTLASLTLAADGFVDSGYACKVDKTIPVMVVTAPPAGLVSVGGYRFAMRDLQEAVRKIDGSGTLVALPDALRGHRLAGSAPSHERIQEGLAALGVNPLLVNAFREQDALTRR